MALNRWDPAAPAPADDLDARVLTSRLLGQDPSLVLHGGGNTSVKVTRTSIVGAEERLLLVKGSGWDLASIEAAGFTPLRIEPLVALATLDRLSDVEMARQLASYRTDPAAPSPSVEAILHGLLPFTFVDHTHADAVVTLTNTAGGAGLVREVYGASVLVLPYVMPGFDLARLVARSLPSIGPDTRGIVLMNHGIVTFGDTARESYDRMIDLVSVAEAAIAPREPLPAPAPPLPRGPSRRAAIAGLRADVSRAAGAPMIVSVHDDDAVLAFAQHPKVADLSGGGPATPDHVIRTKPAPMLGRDVAAFAAGYTAYFDRCAAGGRAEVTMLDPAPRVILDPELGLVTAGRSAADAAAAEDIYRHTIEIVLNAEALGGYRALSEQEIFDVEYWDLEQAKLRRAGRPAPLAGQVALVTGAAGGIGRAIAGRFLAAGGAVAGLDLDPAVAGAFDGASWLGLGCDVTDAGQVGAALDAVTDTFGGLDILVLNAGIFPAAAPVAELDSELWRRVMRVNLDAAADLLREAHPLLRQAPGGGRVVVIGSKNVAAPGPGAAAYSASKAALTQLARVTALEWAADGIRVNVVHPDAVFDTGIWAGGVLEARAAHYGLSVEDYTTRNLLHTQITSADVAELALALTGPAFAKTTGAQIPIDGGNDRVI
ncbi:bifunctional aldolase/short-chain dehydrogenase [Jiangella anatolica]|uniref:Bifunctional aldolase/short-chain dehydrogenase n=1 Tax=Jiangella anatolica TaxID=2670374 RepID=A0A2W2BD69_9ACTN|nr:bifunctional aldolase/short-chain dehydrogenase [Jiangella anatolica]PZF85581.1 bifunctional aldolase/short-chain dehydrogenase [Jiangella anatolica]